MVVATARSRSRSRRPRSGRSSSSAGCGSARASRCRRTTAARRRRPSSAGTTAPGRASRPARRSASSGRRRPRPARAPACRRWGTSRPATSARYARPCSRKLQEQPLVPAVVVGSAVTTSCSQRERRAHRPELAAHVLDVRHRPGERVAAALDRGVLGRQPERVEADREEDVVAVHPAEARQRVGRRDDVPVADVQVARRIRVHRQQVVLGPGSCPSGPCRTGRARAQRACQRGSMAVGS